MGRWIWWTTVVACVACNIASDPSPEYQSHGLLTQKPAIEARSFDEKLLDAQLRALSGDEWSELHDAKPSATLRLYREVVARASTLGTDGTCSPTTTASWRRKLKGEGIDLQNKDIDHIVPRALGGVDHPMNFQVLDSSLNRSLGKTWNESKCEIAGRARCIEAIAISIKCGSYRGGFF